MHLPGDAHGADPARGLPLEHPPCGREARLPPAVRVLLRPAGLGRLEGQRRRGGSDDIARGVDHERLDSARADVQAQKQGARDGAPPVRP